MKNDYSKQFTFCCIFSAFKQKKNLFNYRSGFHLTEVGGDLSKLLLGHAEEHGRVGVREFLERWDGDGASGDCKRTGPYLTCERHGAHALKQRHWRRRLELRRIEKMKKRNTENLTGERCLNLTLLWNDYRSPRYLQCLLKIKIQ